MTILKSEIFGIMKEETQNGCLTLGKQLIIISNKVRKHKNSIQIFSCKLYMA